MASSFLVFYALTAQLLWTLQVPFAFLTFVQPNYQQLPATVNLMEEFAKQSSIFSAKLHNEMSKPNTNAIYSPFSIQACLAMSRMGATGETAKELDYGLNLGSSDAASIADTFYNILAKYKDSAMLQIANKIYVSDQYTIQKEFEETIRNKFLSAIDLIDFLRNVEAANTINHWVESKINNSIKNLIAPSDLGEYTRLVLVNAIHFKGEWLNLFPKEHTMNNDFFLNEIDSVEVPMMNLQASLPYVDLPDLDATAIQMPYNNSDLSMLVILPNSRTGLNSLEQKLKTIALIEITSKMTTHLVRVELPKFNAEFAAELNGPLQKLGISRIFSDKAEFPNMLESPEEIAVSKIMHKAYIEVNEQGTKAAATSGVIKRRKRSSNVFPIDDIEFKVDHPFLYFINHQEKPSIIDDRSRKSISPIPLFQGTVVTLNAVIIE